METFCFVGKDANFSQVVTVNDWFLLCIGAAMFCQQLQFLSLFRLHRRLSILGGTLRYSAASLVNFLLPFSVFFTAFFVLGYVVFGRLMWNYRDPLHSVYEQLATMLGKFRAKDMSDISGIWGRVFLVTYNMCIIYLFLNMMITIIIDIHTEVHDDVLSRETEAELIDLLLERIRGPTIKSDQALLLKKTAAQEAVAYSWESKGDNTSVSTENSIVTAGSGQETASSKPEMVKSGPDTAASHLETDASKEEGTTSRPGTAPSRAETAASGAETAATRPETAASRPETAESRPETAASKPETATSRPRTAASRPETAASSPGTAKSKPETSESRPTSAVVTKIHHK